MLTNGVIEIIFISQILAKFEDREDGGNSTTPLDIYLPYHIVGLFDIVIIGVGYCFIHGQGNARSLGNRIKR